MSDSEGIPEEVLRRPHYTNDELIDLTCMAREYGMNINIIGKIGILGKRRKTS